MSARAISSNLRTLDTIAERLFDKTKKGPPNRGGRLVVKDETRAGAGGKEDTP